MYTFIWSIIRINSNSFIHSFKNQLIFAQFFYYFILHINCIIPFFVCYDGYDQMCKMFIKVNKIIK